MARGDVDHSETSAMIFQDESSDIDTEPSYSCDAELNDEIIGEALSSPMNRLWIFSEDFL